MSKSNRKGEAYTASPTELQKRVINFLRSNTISIVEGEAGTAKDFCCLYYALNELKNGSTSKVIMTKPIVEVGKSIGYLPGSQDEKTSVYMESFIDNAEKIVGRPQLVTMVNAKEVEFKPISYCRGNTFDYSVVILSEAQNCTLHQLITFVTRVSSTSKLLINGDLLQSDIKDSGFQQLIEILSDIDGVGYMYLDEEYQMRSPLIVEINRKYRAHLESKTTYNENRNPSKMV